MFCFGFLRIFGEKSQKSKRENLGKHGLLRHSVGNLRLGVALRRSVGCLATARLRCPKGYPSGMPRRSKATPRRRPMPQRSSAMSRRSYCTP